MNFMKRNWLKSRWIGTPPLKAGELLRPSKQVKQGLVMGMRLAVLEEQAAAVMADGHLVAVFLPGAYQLEQDKMPPLKVDAKCDWLYPAQLYFLNLAAETNKPWLPQEPLLTRDPERGLVQLTLCGNYDAQVENAAMFMQSMVLEHSFFDWPALHGHLTDRLNGLAVSLLAHNKIAIARLDKMKEKIALTLQQEINYELRGSGLTIRALRIQTLEVHPLMQHLLQEQQDYLSFNQAMRHSIMG